MRKLITFAAGVATCLFIAVLFLIPSARAFSGDGTGLDADNPFVITTCAQLQEMGDDLEAWYVLGNNIDCSDTVNWNEGDGFDPVGDPFTPFTGELEGAGYTITGLTINLPTNPHIGLFGYMGSGSLVQHFRLNDVSIIGEEYVGAVAGQILNGEMQEISITGEVSGEDVVGGAVGDNGGSVYNMYSHANISGVPGSGVGGGLVGENHGFTIRSYSTGIVPTGTGKGGIIGHDADSGGVSGAFWDTQTSGNVDDSWGVGKTSAQLKNVATFTVTGTEGLGSPWDFVNNPNNDVATDDIWNIHPRINQGYPYLVGQTPGVPESLLVGVPSNPATSRSLSFEFVSNVEPTTFECKIEPAITTFQACTSPFVYEAEEDGDYVFEVRAINSDGVNDQTPAQRTVEVDSAYIDTDGDSVLDTIEDAGPNNGDADDSGAPDSTEGEAVSLPGAGGEYVVVRDAGNTCDFTSVTVSDETDLLVPDTDYRYPGGLVNFTLNCGTPGLIPDIKVFFYGLSTEQMVARKFNPTTEMFATVDPEPPILSIGSESVRMTTYPLEDGGPLDTDGLVDGIIVDPVGFAELAAADVIGSTDGPPASVATGLLASTGIDTRHILFITTLFISSSIGLAVYQNFKRHKHHS